MLNINFIQNPTSSEVESNILYGKKLFTIENCYSFTEPQNFKIFFSQNNLDFDDSSLYISNYDNSSVTDFNEKIDADEIVSNLSYLCFINGPVFPSNYFDEEYLYDLPDGLVYLKNNLFLAFKEVVDKVKLKYSETKVMSSFFGKIVSPEESKQLDISSIIIFLRLSFYYSNFILNCYFHKSGSLFITGTKINNSEENYEEFIETVIDCIKNLEL